MLHGIGAPIAESAAVIAGVEMGGVGGSKHGERVLRVYVLIPRLVPTFP